MEKEKAQFTVRMPSETGKKLAYMADYYGRSVNGQVVWLIRKAIASFEQEHGKIELADLEENK
ncbi:MAG: Arc family DNA-binding protein [Candidatus Onthomonas sp.]|nr:Arc family DNA-binding protein [Candidatus Onthomonas sp.]